MDRKRSLAGLIALGIALSGLPAFAADAPAPQDNPTTKLARGLANTAFGWAEVPKQAGIGAQEKQFPGLIEGTLKGLVMGVGRTAAGAVEIGTFWAPIPDGYGPVLNPPTVFEKER